RSTLAIGRSPTAIAVSPDGTAVYVLSAGDAHIAVVDPVGERIAVIIPVDPDPTGIAISPLQANLLPGGLPSVLAPGSAAPGRAPDPFSETSQPGRGGGPSGAAPVTSVPPPPLPPLPSAPPRTGDGSLALGGDAPSALIAFGALLVAIALRHGLVRRR
ncbi:MAG: hypothetical protein NZ518_03090, partial [Dehalococcoidia bacterium]|nr:hypothetical protein [Dehalococcoidia bacterium]